MERNRRGRPRHPDVLTPAEWRVLDALREGGTNAEIAARLGLSLDTVKYHISNMLAKLELRDRRALASWRPEERRGRLGALFTVPTFVWAVARPIAWVGAGMAAVAGVVAGVVALVALVAVMLVTAGGGADPPLAVALQPLRTSTAVPTPDHRDDWYVIGDTPTHEPLPPGLYIYRTGDDEPLFFGIPPGTLISFRGIFHEVGADGLWLDLEDIRTGSGLTIGVHSITARRWVNQLNRYHPGCSYELGDPCEDRGDAAKDAITRILASVEGCAKSTHPICDYDPPSPEPTPEPRPPRVCRPAQQINAVFVSEAELLHGGYVMRSDGDRPVTYKFRIRPQGRPDTPPTLSFSVPEGLLLRFHARDEETITLRHGETDLWVRYHLYGGYEVGRHFHGSGWAAGLLHHVSSSTCVLPRE